MKEVLLWGGIMGSIIRFFSHRFPFSVVTCVVWAETVIDGGQLCMQLYLYMSPMPADSSMIKLKDGYIRIAIV